MNRGYRVFGFRVASRRTAFDDELGHRGTVEDRPGVQRLGPAATVLVTAHVVFVYRGDEQPVVRDTIGQTNLGCLRAVVVSDFAPGLRNRVRRLGCDDARCEIHDYYARIPSLFVRVAVKQRERLLIIKRFDEAPQRGFEFCNRLGLGGQCGDNSVRDGPMHRSVYRANAVKNVQSDFAHKPSVLFLVMPLDGIEAQRSLAIPTEPIAVGPVRLASGLSARAASWISTGQYVFRGLPKRDGASIR